ncbi:hypothetical protein [Nonomuraea sp. NPDC048901]|uniref:hypothetical protein n=1 Tax=Nonomuraea sp. NPDC048901 TaxID=3155627 RepID=UPI003401A09D
MTVPRISTGDGGPVGIRDALHRLVTAPVESGGRWKELPDRITVGKRLTGGRAGAHVFEITAHWGGTSWRYVAKLGPAEEMAKEWNAFQAHFVDRKQANTLCAPIDLAAPAVHDEGKRVRGRPEMIVYGHVAEFAGTSGASLLTLEDLAGRNDIERTTKVIRVFGRKAHSVLYKGAKPQSGPGSLWGQIATLGPMLTLDHDGADGPYLHSDELLALCLHPDPGPEPVRARLSLTLTPDEDGYQADFYGLRVRVRASAELTTGQPVEISGTVAETYAGSRWSVISGVCRDLRREGADVVWGSERTTLPFGQLLDLLTREEEDRAVSLVHGDLNPRNIVLSDEQPFLIDFAKTAAGQPVLADHAWLELGLLRDVLAGRHDFSELLLLQRLLALAGRALDAVAGESVEERAAGVEAAFLAAIRQTAPGLEGSFRVLWAVRSQGRSSYPAEAGPRWWREYLAQLVIAANRTFKWARHEHTPAAMSAAVAAAGAASEMWRGEDVLRRWRPSTLRAVAGALIPILAPRHQDAVTIAADLVTGLDHGGVRDDRIERLLGEFRARLVTPLLRGRAGRGSPRRDPPWYVPLTAYAAEGDPPGEDAQSLLARESHVVLLGEALSGKSTVLEELRVRLTRAGAGPGTGRPPPRLPLPVDARVLAAEPGAAVLRAAWTVCELPPDWAESVPALLATGAICLLVDHLDHLDADAGANVLAWLRELVDGGARRSAVVVACRTAAYDLSSGTGPFQVHVLAPPSPAVIEPFLIRALGSRDAAARTSIERLVREDPHDADQVSRWPAPMLWSPALLPLIHLLADEPDPPLTVSGLLAQYVDRLFATRPRTGSAMRERALTAIAHELTSRRAEEIPAAALSTLPTWPSHAPGLVDDLVGCGLLTRTAGSVGFTHAVLRDYFTALALYHAGCPDPLGLVTEFRWHGAILLLLNMHDGADPVVDSLVTAAVRHDGALAVEFLRAASTRPAALLTRISDRLLEELVAPAVRDDTREHVAAALADLGGRPARELLGTVAADPSSPPEARTAALRGLERMTRRASGTACARARAALREACAAVLTADPPARVCSAALGAVRRADLYQLLPRVCELIDPDRPWLVTEAAMAALRAVEADATPAIERRWAVSCTRRLQETEKELTDAAGHDEYARLRGERRRLLEELCAARHLDVLLRHRFRFDVADDVAELLDALRSSVPPPRARLASSPGPPGLTGTPGASSVPDLDPPVPAGSLGAASGAARAWTVLTAPSEHADLVGLLESQDELVSLAAAHRLLPDEAAVLVADVTAEASPGRLLATAAAVAELDAVTAADLLERAELLVRALAETASPARLEPLAALVTGVFAVDRARGVRLALHSARMLQDREVAGRQTWPWSAAFARARGALADLTALLMADDETARLAIFGLASFGFLIDAGPGPDERLDRRGTARFRSLQPDGTGLAAWRYVMAAATVGVTDVLPYACRLAVAPGAGSASATVATSGYGRLEETDLAGVLAAIGYLGRICAQEGDRDRAESARGLLSGFPVAAEHSSVAVGRLAGLAYLGEWRQVLPHVEHDEPRLARIAANAVQRWRGDGPGDDDRDVALLIAERLGSAALPDGVRSVLTRLRRTFELRAGFFTGRLDE